MHVINPGHVYDLGRLDGDGYERLTFVKRSGIDYPGNVGEHAGTTMQEVIRALIDRCCYVERQRPAPENATVIASLRAALRSLEERAARMHGITTTFPDDGIEQMLTCRSCGHIVCKHGENGRTDAKQA